MHNNLIMNLPFLFLVLFVVFFVYDFSVYLEEKKQKSDFESYKRSILAAGVILSRTGNQKIAIHIKVFLVCVVLIFVAVFLSMLFGGVDPEKEIRFIDLFSSLKESYEDDSYRLVKHLVFVVIVFVTAMISYLALKNERLILTKNGIKYIPIFKSKFFQNFNSAWSIDWNDVESVTQGKVKVKNEVIIKTKNKKSRTLQLNAWKELSKSDQVTVKSLIGLVKYQQKMAKDAAFSFKENVLSRYIIDVVGLSISKTPETDLNFDLSSNKYSLGAVVVFFIFMAYAATGAMISSETYVSDVPYLWFVIFGLFIAIISGVILSKNKVPLTNAWGLALLLGGMAGVAMYPGIININQFTDNHGLVEYGYQRVNENIFEPVNTLLPHIAMKKDEYWESIPMNHDVSFMIRKGGLGFYQIDMEPEYKKMRQWYCLKRAAGDTDQVKKCRHVE
ncbi:MAG: hypothetical protein KAQ67_10180 [Gammaproteobacteria bacterium]|nr:hypothetical protein [Gammaproteobacteria bacterium]